MNFVKFLLTFTLLAMASVKVHCLECYVCTEDCDDHLNLRPQVCGASTTTTPTTTTEATTTPTTTRQTTMGFSTSSIPPTSTVTTTTTAGTSTTTTDATTTSTTTTQPTTTSTDTTTSPATTTPLPTTTRRTDAPTTETPITEAPTTEAPTTEAPTTEAPITAAPTVAAAVRNRRSLSQKELAVNHLLQNYRSNSRQRRDTDASAWACYAINKEDGESKTRVYGCVSIPQDETACLAIRNEVGLSSDADEDKYQCSFCFTDNCNGSATLKLSIVALAGVLLLKWLL